MSMKHTYTCMNETHIYTLQIIHTFTQYFLVQNTKITQHNGCTTTTTPHTVAEKLNKIKQFGNGLLHNHIYPRWMVNTQFVYVLESSWSWCKLSLFLIHMYYIYYITCILIIHYSNYVQLTPTVAWWATYQWTLQAYWIWGTPKSSKHIL